MSYVNHLLLVCLCNHYFIFVISNFNFQNYIVIDERDNQDIAELLDEADPELNSEFENLNAGTISIAEKRSLQRQGEQHSH